MNDKDLDQLLMMREEIVPSSGGFVASVMEAVQQEARLHAGADSRFRGNGRCLDLW